MKNDSLLEIIQHIQNGKTSAQEVHNYFSERIKKYDSKVRSYVSTEVFDSGKTYTDTLA
jgi:Asp-tRNA(Asn)/Glu-tRNA(Gln) amidotransferase A subunit family amidase